MSHTTFTWQSAGKQLFGQQWTPESAPKAVMLLIHGHGEHSGRYEHVAKFLTKSGIAVVAYDNFGHGKSGLKKGHVPSYAAVMDSISEALARVKAEFSGVPCFLFGHSMGGTFVASYALTHKAEIKGVILSAPWFRLAFEPSATDVKLAKFMIRIWPSFTQGTKLDATAISRDPAEVKRYVDDPLVHDKVSPVLFLGTHEAGLDALEQASSFAYPLLILHGTGDRLTSHEASQEFAEKVSGDVSFQLQEGLFHEMHNEPEQEKIMAMYRDWMLERC